MTKTFSHAGVSRLHGKLKVRWANGAERVKVLIKGGHTDIDLIEMIAPKTKEDAVAYLLEINFDNGDAEVRACLEAEAVKRGVPGYEKPKAEKPVEEEVKQEDAVTEEGDTADNVIDISEEVAVEPAAVRNDKGQFVKKTSAASDAMTAWAEAANAEEAAEAAAEEEAA